MGPRVHRHSKRKRWVIVAAVYAYLAVGLAAWADGVDFLEAFASAHAWAVGFGVLDAAPPTNTGHGNTDEQFDFSDALTYAQDNGLYVTVSSSSGLTSAFASAVPGTYIRITAGTYSWSSVTLQGAAGSAARPVVIDGNSSVTFSNITRGLKFLGCTHVVCGRMTFATTVEYAAWIEKSPYVRLTQITGTGLGTDNLGIGYVRIHDASNYWRVDHCSFTSGGRQGIQLYWYKDVVGTGYVISAYGRIDRNTFAGVTVAAAPAAIQLGQGSNDPNGIDMHYASGGGGAYCTVEYNYFNALSQDEGVYISVKTQGNVIRYNYARSCKGGVELRAGTHNEYYSNYSSGCNRGPANHLYINDRYHTVVNNIFIQQSGTCSQLFRIWNGTGWRQLTATRWGVVPETAYNTIANNTMIAGGAYYTKEVFAYYGDSTTYGEYGDTSVPAIAAHHNTIVNNIIVATGTTTGKKLSADDDNNAQPYSDTITNNVWYMAGGGTYGEIYADDAAPITGDPNLSAAWVPQGGSNALGAGVYQVAAVLDYYGNNRAVGVMDCGAIQVTLSPPAQRGAGLNRGQVRGGFIGGYV